jgi:peptidoglycan L-alanyl-D-glutamate endopeptidase CwlK
MTLNQRSLDRLKGVKQILIDILIEAAKDSPYEFQIPADGGLRTAARQKELFDKKLSKCDGYKNKSYHQTGNAFDIFLLIEGRASWDKAALTKTARHIQSVAEFDFKTKLEWGGDWKWKDMPHFQIS